MNTDQSLNIDELVVLARFRGLPESEQDRIIGILDAIDAAKLDSEKMAAFVIAVNRACAGRSLNRDEIFTAARAALAEIG